MRRYAGRPQRTMRRGTARMFPFRLLRGVGERSWRIGVDAVGPDDLDGELLVDADHLRRGSVLAVLVRLEDRLAQGRPTVDELDALAAESHEPATILIQQRQLAEFARSVGHRSSHSVPPPVPNAPWSRSVPRRA